jgi:hypothetical protein
MIIPTEAVLACGPAARCSCSRLPRASASPGRPRPNCLAGSVPGTRQRETAPPWSCIGDAPGRGRAEPPGGGSCEVSTRSGPAARTRCLMPASAEATRLPEHGVPPPHTLRPPPLSSPAARTHRPRTRLHLAAFCVSTADSHCLFQIVENPSLTSIAFPSLEAVEFFIKVRSYCALFLFPRAHIPHTTPTLPPSVSLPAPGPLHKPGACTPQPHCSPSETLLVRGIIPAFACQCTFGDWRTPSAVLQPRPKRRAATPPVMHRHSVPFNTVPSPPCVHAQISYNGALETLDLTKLALIGATIAEMCRCLLSPPSPSDFLPPMLLPPFSPSSHRCHRRPPSPILACIPPKPTCPPLLVCPVHGPRRSLAHGWIMANKMQSPAASADHPLMHCSFVG